MSIEYQEFAPNFPLSELQCKCGCETPGPVLVALRKLSHRLQTIRDAFGKPITIESGYRCPEHNKKVGGAEKSLHLKGMAADLKFSEKSGDFAHGFIEGLIAAGRLDEGGIGRYRKYPDMVHYDYRGKRARWVQ